MRKGNKVGSLCHKLESSSTPVWSRYIENICNAKTLQECLDLFDSTKPERGRSNVSLLKAFNEHFVLFRSLDPHHVEGFAQFASLDSVLKDSVVIRQGDEGHTFTCF